MRILGASILRADLVPRDPTQPLHVLHLDHTVAPGGAELALARLLSTPPPWQATLLLPQGSRARGLGVFGSLRETSRLSVVMAGPEQRPGASKTQWREVSPTMWSIARSAWAIRTSTHFRSADVVHANTSRAALIGSLAALGTRTCMVVHLRDRVEPESLGRFGTRSLGWALGRATGVIANSHSTLATAEPYLGRRTERIVIPSPAGLTMGSVPRTAAKRPRAGSTVERIVMVARVDPWKGHDVLLEAFAGVFRGTSTRLVLAGGTAFGHDGHLGDLRTLAAGLGIARQVDFLGHVDDVSTLLADADICVQASVRPEPLGQNVLQYLAAGKPVIATRGGGPAEWVENGVNGLLVPMNDSAALASALRRLRDTPSLREHLSVNASSTPGLRSDVDIVDEHHRFLRYCLRRHRGGLSSAADAQAGEARR